MDRTIPAAKQHRIATSFRVPDYILSIGELVQRHELLWHMTVRHLRGQYKQSILGFAWSFVNPLSLMLILSFVFSTILKVPSQGIPFPLYLTVGLIPWLFFSGAVSSATDSVTGASSLVTKVYFPREILPIAAVLTKVVDFLCGLVILMALMVYYGHLPTETVLWMPVLLAIHLAFTLGVSFPLAALNLYLHDVRYLVGVALTLWFYLTPIMYPLSIVPDRFLWVYDINPNALLVDAYRRVILLDSVPAVDRLLIGFGISMVTLVIGYYLFKKMERGFADSI
jgi:lipopolysaccharide transport system permease protein